MMSEAGLNPRQKRFCEEYLRDFNGGAAVLRAGYQCNVDAARVQASRLLTNAKVQAQLQQLRDRVSANAQMSLEQVVQEIARVAFSNITQVLSFTNDGGVKLKGSDELPDEVSAAIASVASSKSKTVVRLHNKVKALTLLADFYGLRSDFNQARATLKRYGLALVEDDQSPCGWRVECYFPGVDAVEEAELAAAAFFPDD